MNKKKKILHKKKPAQKKENKIKKTSIGIDSGRNHKNLGKVIIVHGWDGDISKGWYPWLKQELESKGFDVLIRQMPHYDAPAVDEWVYALKDISGRIDEKTYFIGHSVGCQTIIRALEKPDVDKVGGAIFIAGWFELKEKAYTEYSKTEKDTRRIAKPWINTPIDFNKVQSRFSPGKITAIFSDNDPYVDMLNAHLFKDRLGAKIIVENNKGHYRPEDDANVIPLLVEELLNIVK